MARSIRHHPKLSAFHALSHSRAGVPALLVTHRPTSHQLTQAEVSLQGSGGKADFISAPSGLTASLH